jgi:hypothetical protein
MKWWLVLLLAWPAWGQGVDNEWDVRKLLAALSSQTRRLKPILDQSDPKTWSDASAAQSYGPQWKTAQNEIQYLTTTAEAFAKQPERITMALETYLRLDSLETTLSSFTDGMRKYGNPAVAQLLEGTMRENGVNREHLRQYLVELAKTKEQELEIMDKEAQRCRAGLSRQAPPPASRPAAKKKED